MAGETQTNQSSAQGSGQQSSQGGEQSGGSGANQTTGGGQPSQQQAQAPERPAWVPDQFWDPKAGVKGDDLAKQFNELSAFKAADDSKRLALPQTEKDYKLALPKDFQPPQGVEFKLDEADPLFAQARTWAKENGLSQEAFEKGIGMIAARDVATQQMLTEARNQEIAKLGVNGTARVTALNTFLDAKGLAPIKGMLVTADIVQAVEKMVGMVTAGGNFDQRHRDNDAPGKLSDEEHAKLSFAEKRAYAEKFPQPATQMNGR